MSLQFERSGVRFQYPDDWTLEQEENDNGWLATVSSPETAFLLVSYHTDVDDPAGLADMALEAMRESYPELESETVMETLAGLPAIGHDVDFVALDLTNSCRIRSLAGPEGCLLLLSQCTDEELSGNGNALRAIGASLSVDDD
jgi:hypothetical protein